MASPSPGWSTSATTSISRREHTWWTITQLDMPVSPYPVASSKAQSSLAQARGASWASLCRAAGGRSALAPATAARSVAGCSSGAPVRAARHAAPGLRRYELPLQWNERGLPLPQRMGNGRCRCWSISTAAMSPATDAAGARKLAKGRGADSCDRAGAHRACSRVWNTAP